MPPPALRTIVYIDGLNLYYSALKWTLHKWLDLETLSALVLPGFQIDRINYYTARVSGRVDRQSPVRQHAYLRALSTLPKLTIHFGNFLASEKWAGLVQPPAFKPAIALPPGIVPQVARVHKTEEKGSDVNLGVHLVRDAFKGYFDTAAVLTNDTDLCEPLRIVTQELNLPVVLLSPTSKPAISLQKVSNGVRHIEPYLGPAQFPPSIPVPGKKTIIKPASW
jgi:uncharacterized LabA/DUF88 family protein